MKGGEGFFFLLPIKCTQNFHGAVALIIKAIDDLGLIKLGKDILKATIITMISIDEHMMRFKYELQIKSEERFINWDGL